MKHCR